MATASSLLESRALVSDGSGLLGSHLCDRLIRRRQEVLCVDNLFTVRSDNQDECLDRAVGGMIVAVGRVCNA